MMSKTLRDSAESTLNPEHLRPNLNEAFDIANKHMAIVSAVASFIHSEVHRRELEWYREFLHKIEKMLSDEEMRRGQGFSEQNHELHPHPDLLERVRTTIEDIERLMAPRDIHV